MVKTPRTRHSKTQREPLTIELDPADVSRVSETETVSPAAADSIPGAPESPSEARVAAEDSADATAQGTDATAQGTDATAPGADEIPAAGTEARSDDVPNDPVSNESEPATETGTAPQPDQEYQPGEPVREPAGYRFDEAEERQPQPGRAESPASRDDAAAPPQLPPRSDGFSRIAAGVIGAVVALAAAGGLQYAGLLGAPHASPGSSPQANAEIESLRQEIAAVRSDAGAGDLAARVDGLSSALDTLKADVAALREAAPAAGSGDAAALQGLDDRIKQIEADIAALGQAPDAADLSALGERVAAVEALARTENDSAAEAGDRLAALEQTVGSLAGRVDAQAQQPKIALAIATAALKAAVDRGAPFAAELETFAAIFPAAPELAALRAHAEKGVSTREALLAELEPAATAMIAAAKPVDPDAGIVDRLMQSAESLVTVRPVGAVEGAGVPEIVARMEAALTAGDLDKAIAEYDSLPDAAKAAAGGFGDKLKARRDVEKLVDQAIAGAMKA
jgi:hypothetical protein